MAKDVIDELVYHTLFQWKTEGELSENELAIRDEDIINIAKIAGVFQPLFFSETSLGSMYFTPSHIVDGKERSERGLMNMRNERFEFIQTLNEDYPDDIVKEATNEMRSSFVPDGTEPDGYLLQDTELYDEEGNVLWKNLLNEPPEDGTPYTPYYGEKYLTSERFYRSESFLDIEIFKSLFECMQRIRHKGHTTESFLAITRILGGDYIYNIEIIKKDYYFTVRYSIKAVDDTRHIIQRIAVWQYICKQKFKLFVLVQIE
jgi:hypothetical protein